MMKKWIVSEIPETTWNERKTYNVIDQDGHEIIGNEGLFDNEWIDLQRARLICESRELLKIVRSLYNGTDLRDVLNTADPIVEKLKDLDLETL